MKMLSKFKTAAFALSIVASIGIGIMQGPVQLAVGSVGSSDVWCTHSEETWDCPDDPLGPGGCTYTYPVYRDAGYMTVMGPEEFKEGTLCDDGDGPCYDSNGKDWAESDGCQESC